MLVLLILSGQELSSKPIRYPLQRNQVTVNAALRQDRRLATSDGLWCSVQLTDNCKNWYVSATGYKGLNSPRALLHAGPLSERRRCEASALMALSWCPGSSVPRDSRGQLKMKSKLTYLQPFVLILSFRACFKIVV